MADGHPNQRVEIRALVKEALPVGKQVTESIQSFGRGVDVGGIDMLARYVDYLLFYRHIT
jgi:hypothetical protein